MSITTESYTAGADQIRRLTQQSVQAWQHGAKRFTDQLGRVQVPTVDLTQPVAQYFDYLQKTVDLQRDFVTKWVELVTSVSGSARQQTQQILGIVSDQVDAIADQAVQQADRAEQSQRDSAQQVEDAAKAQARESDRVERAKARKAQEQAREAYEGLTKADLSDQLSDRGLPKTGTVDELIERLVSADSQ